jgi:hypothetical protein
MPSASFTRVLAPDKVARDWVLTTQGETLFLMVPAGTPAASLDLKAAVAVGNGNSNRSVVLKVEGVLPSAVALQESISAAQLQRAAETAAQFLPVLISAGIADNVQPIGAIAVPIRGVNQVVIPALRSSSAAASAAAAANWTWFAAAGRLGSQGFVRDPGMTAVMTLVQLAADNTTPAVNGTQQVLAGNWSSTQQGYVLAFSCPMAATYWLELSFTATYSNGSIAQVRGGLFVFHVGDTGAPAVVCAYSWYRWACLMQH